MTVAAIPTSATYGKMKSQMRLLVQGTQADSRYWHHEYSVVRTTPAGLLINLGKDRRKPGHFALKPDLPQRDCPKTTTQDYLERAVKLAYDNVVDRGGRPFGAVLVKDGAVLATGVNDIVATNDPSRHAEMQAIRAAAATLKSPRLDGCTMYASGQPCPMCLSAMHMIGISEICYAYSNDDAEPYGLSTARIYSEMA